MTIIEGLLIGALLLIAAFAVLTVFLAWKVIGMLMWFHRAGKSMTEHELEKARIDVQKLQYEAQIAQANVEKARAEAQQIRNPQPSARFGGEPTRIPVGAAG